MTAAYVVLGFLAYAGAAVITYRLEYVREFEEHAPNEYRVKHARSCATFAAVMCPGYLWWALLVRYGTPTPPSVAAQIAAEESKRAMQERAALAIAERERNRRLDEMERFLQIGKYRPDPLDEIQ